MVHFYVIQPILNYNVGNHILFIVAFSLIYNLYCFEGNKTEFLFKRSVIKTFPVSHIGHVLFRISAGFTVLVL